MPTSVRLFSQDKKHPRNLFESLFINTEQGSAPNDITRDNWRE